jgi:superfamily II DNA or RNA helicase
MGLITILNGLAHLSDFSDKEMSHIETFCTYHDKQADFALKKFKKGTWFIAKYGQDAYNEKLAELKAAQKRSLLFQDADGNYTTYSGLIPELVPTIRALFGNVSVEDKTFLPARHPIPWKKQPFPMRPYQVTAVDALSANNHSAIEYGTGVGKSRIILQLVRDLGLKTIVMVPSKQIGAQMFDTLKTHLGENKVGYYGDGKKVSKKLVTVGIAASLTRIEPGDQAWDDLREAQVLISDESHFLAADTFEKVCMGVAANCAYRWSVSGTQIRGDGSELLLKGLTGPVVSRMTVKDGVDQGWLARPVFHMFQMPSDSSYWTDDANTMTRVHLYQNKAILKAVGDMTKKFVEMGKSVVILIDEVEQFTRLLPHLPDGAKMAHGGLTADNRGKVPLPYHKSDPKALVKSFNDGEFKVLVGTSCISTGTDILPVEAIFYLVGGKSTISCSQSVGRGTRKIGSKTECHFIDFTPLVYSPSNNVDDNGSQRAWSVLRRHAQARAIIYDSIYGPVNHH